MSLQHKIIQKKLRLKLLEMYKTANAGHIGCSLSCIDLIIASLVLNKTATEDFILSKGHAAAALYASLNFLELIDNDILDTFYKDGTVLPAHPAPNKIKGIPFATGSLGHGLPISVGIALGNKMLANNDFTYVLMSDGETNEGTTWEAAHFAVQKKLENLIVMIDKNGIQGFGNTLDVFGETAMKAKWELIGFDVVEGDGHDIEFLSETIQYLKTQQNSKPKLIIANTIKGKGVSYMENKMEWHYNPMNEVQYLQAMADVEAFY
jgi:transketolase